MRTLPQFFEESVNKFPDNKFMWEKQGDQYAGATFTALREQVHQFAAGLISLGVSRDDRIALLAEGRNDWLVSELGILYTGAVNVPLSIMLSESEIKFRLEHSEARMIIITRNNFAKLEAIKNELSQLEKIILLDEKDSSDSKEVQFKEVKQLGATYLKEHGEDFEKRWKSLNENDFANISYTSGTTAEPKGIILTHLNYYANVHQTYTLMDIDPSWKIFLFLPWDHSFAHSAGLYAFMGKGAAIASLQVGNSAMDSLKNISTNIKEVKPQLMFSVPAFAKNLRKNIESGIKAKGPLIQKLFNHALRLNYAYNKEGINKGGGLQFLKIPLIKLYDAIIFKRVRQQLGGNMEYLIGGGALLDIELQRFFYAIGIPIYQGYGLSEASPVISINCPYKHKLGSSGMPVKNMEINICDDDGHSLPTGVKGEIVIKGENVMAGYWKNEQATLETIKDKWLHTGDMGYIDEDGFLYVLGRFKSLLISDDGEKYSPEGIEEAMIDQSPYIHQCMLYNNQDPYTVVFVVPIKEEVLNYLKDKGLEPGSEDAGREALSLIESEVRAYRTGGKHGDMFPQRWMPAAIGILDEPFSMDNHMINSLGKMVRGKVVEKYQEHLDYLYKPEAKNIANTMNKETIGRLIGS